MDLRDKNNQVVLLIEDIQKAKEVSKIFRNFKIAPIYCDNLRDFWKSTLAEKPFLSIVDVKLINEGDLFLKDHPHVKTGVLNTVIYHTQRTLPLLERSYLIPHIGTLNGTYNFKKQVQAVFARASRLVNIQDENLNLKIRLKTQDNQAEGIVSLVQKAKTQNIIKIC